MFCAEHELQRSKWSDSSGIRKLTSITFWKSKARKIKKRKSMEIIAFKVKISQSASVDLCPFRLEYLELPKSIWCKLNFLDSWLKDLSTFQISSKNKLIWGRYDFSKMTNKFCQQTSFVKKQVQITSRSIQTDIQVFISAI
jgi:hypothetical protein